MKKQIPLIIILLFAAVIGHSQTLDCSKLKNITAYNPDYPKKTFTLKGATQESYENGVLKLVWSVKPISDCVYEITCVKKLSESQTEIGDKITMSIISIDDDCFTVSRTFHCKNFPEGDVDTSTYCVKK